MRETDLLQAALHYHAHGLPVVPVGPDKRANATWGHWRKQKQTEREVLAFSWEKLHGLALLTWPGSDFVVLDFDGPHAEQAWQAQAHIPLPETATNHTRSGGVHRIFRVPAGIPHPGAWTQGTGEDLRRKVRLVVAHECGCKKPCGVDLLLNGYFVAPPTPGYQEDADHPFEPGQCAVLPQAVLEYARTHERPTGRPGGTPGGDWFSAALRGPTPAGQRNDMGTRLAGALLAKGHSVEQTLAVLEPWALTACVPAMDLSELRATVQSVARREAGKQDAPAALPSLESPVVVLRKSQNQGDPIPTGLPVLDSRLRGGMRPGKALVIGGTPFAGKTALGIQIVKAAVESGCVAACLMADEGRESAIIRLGQQLGYAREDLESGHEPTLDAMEQDLAGRVVLFPDPDGEGDMTLEGVAEAMVKAYPDRRKILFVDSIQTVRTRRPEGDQPSLRERVMENARTARRLALECGLVTIYTSEVNRGWYRNRKAEDRSTDLAAFAEARIEFSGDTLLLLRANDEDPELIEIRIPKNRLGTRQPFFLRMNPERALFAVVDGNPSAALRDAAEERLIEKQVQGILQALQASPGLIQTQLAELVGGTRKVFFVALRRVKESGVVTWKPDGRSIRHYLADVPR